MEAALASTAAAASESRSLTLSPRMPTGPPPSAACGKRGEQTSWLVSMRRTNCLQWVDLRRVHLATRAIELRQSVSVTVRSRAQVEVFCAE